MHKTAINQRRFPTTTNARKAGLGWRVTVGKTGYPRVIKCKNLMAEGAKSWGEVMGMKP